jgi:hypothetical protein
MVESIVERLRICDRRMTAEQRAHDNKPMFYRFASTICSLSALAMPFTNVTYSELNHNGQINNIIR